MTPIGAGDRVFAATWRIAGTMMRARAALSLWALRHSARATVGSSVVLIDAPRVHIVDGAQLTIGNRVTLTSGDRGYHAALAMPVKLLLDRAGAEIIIGDDTRIHGACLHAQRSIRIGERCLIASGTQILDCNGHDSLLGAPEGRLTTTGTPRPIVIEDDVWIGVGCVILPGVRIGRGSIVSASSVVTQDVPRGVIVAGNPAQTLRRDP